MQLITGERRSGNTTKLIKMSAESGSVIVCLSHNHAQAVMRHARDIGLDIPMSTTYSMLFDTTRLKTHKYLLDDFGEYTRKLSATSMQMVDDIIDYLRGRDQIEAIVDAK